MSQVVMSREGKAPVVIITFATADDSGAPRMGYYFARHFTSVGCRVIGVIPAGAGGLNTSFVSRMAGIGVEIRELGGIGRSPSLEAIRSLQRLVRQENAGLIVSIQQMDMKFAAAAAWACKVGYVASGQNAIRFFGSPARRLASRTVLGWLIGRACGEVIATSESVAEDFRNVLRFKNKISILPNGVETELFFRSDQARREMRAELKLEGCFVFATAGRITSQKNQIGLLKGFAAMPENKQCVLLIIGDIGSEPADDDYKAALLALVMENNLDLQVRFLGWRKDVGRILSAADCYVQASMWEGCSLAVIEAMASSLPVLVADPACILPGFQEGGHGYAFAPEDPQAIAAVMLKMLKMAEGERLALGNAARKLAVEGFDARRIGAEFTERAMKHYAPSQRLMK